jgi:peroxiredoxin
MKRHPSHAVLSDFAQARLDEVKRTSVADHLAGCARCREELKLVQTVTSTLRDENGVALPSGVWNRVESSVSRGETVLLPAHDAVPMRRQSRGRLALAAAAIVMLLTIPMLFIPRRHLEAESSVLQIGPERPRRGAELTLRYRATKELENEKAVAVRARYVMRENRTEEGVVDLGELRRVGNGIFEGKVTLPDTAVYAVLAIERKGGGIVDDHGQTWEVVVHDATGRPLVDALEAKVFDARMRNTRVMYDAIDSIIVAFPNSSRGYFLKYVHQESEVLRSQQDSLRQVYRVHLNRLTGQVRARPDPTELATLVFFAGAMEDSTLERDLEDQLIRLYPMHSAAVQRTVFRLAKAHRANKSSYMHALDSLYRTGARAPQLDFEGFNTAVAVKDPEAIKTWIARAGGNPAGYVGATQALLQTPSLRAEGVERLLKEIGDLRAGKWFAERPISIDSAEFATMVNRSLAYQLTQYGQVLLEQGDTTNALTALREAESKDWNARRFKLLGDIMIGRGDTAGATNVYAKVLADPQTRDADAQAIRQKIGRVTTLDAKIANARSEMLRYYRARMRSSWPLRDHVSLSDLAGNKTSVDLKQDSVTLVAFWSRYCPPSYMQLKQLDQIAQAARARGVRVIAITDEEPGSELTNAVNKMELKMPLFSDTNREAAAAFHNRGTPRYIVLDREGRIRFNEYSIEDLGAKIEAARN